MEFVSYFLVFFIGYLMGSIDVLKKSLSSKRDSDKHNDVVLGREPTQMFADNPTTKNHQRKKVIIDDTKYVTDISTEGMEQKGVSLGVVSQADDDISSATKKLASLKRLKDS